MVTDTHTHTHTLTPHACPTCYFSYSGGPYSNPFAWPGGHGRTARRQRRGMTWSSCAFGHIRRGGRLRPFFTRLHLNPLASRVSGTRPLRQSASRNPCLLCLSVTAGGRQPGAEDENIVQERKQKKKKNIDHRLGTRMNQESKGMPEGLHHSHSATPARF